jgi:uncharacterized protein (DUF58 family)
MTDGEWLMTHDRAPLMKRPRMLSPISLVGGWLVTHRARWTGAGLGYMGVWLLLLITGLYQQINLLVLTAGLTLGPIVASYVISRKMLSRVEVSRRLPDFVFAGQPLALDYILENRRTFSAALALEVVDELSPVDKSAPNATRVVPRIFFDRVPPGERGRIRWQGPGLARGKYTFGELILKTRAPFGLQERSKLIPMPASLVVYPAIGRLARRWHQIHRESVQTTRGRRHDRTAQQQEYHGLREYRAGDSMRWIHWRTSARLGHPMVKEFEQQNDQELAVLLDGWLPRSKVTGGQRIALERAVQFAATVCYETCRVSGRRILLGWTGPTPGVREGPASVKLLHEMLESLAILRGSPEGHLAALIDAMPPAVFREAMILVVSTRPVNLAEEAERSSRLAEASLRGLASRVVMLDASRGDLDPLIDFAELPDERAEAAPDDTRGVALATGSGNGRDGRAKP